MEDFFGKVQEFFDRHHFLRGLGILLLIFYIFAGKDRK